MSWRARNVERRGDLTAMQVELYHAYRNMNALLTQDIAAPLYRMPLTFFEQALPKLIGEGRLTADEISGLVEYVMRAEELNRGLDGAAAAGAFSSELVGHFRRNQEKTKHILNDHDKRLGDMTVFESAWNTLFRIEDDAKLLRRVKKLVGVSTKGVKRPLP